jgi:hypothetical protein
VRVIYNFGVEPIDLSGLGVLISSEPLKGSQLEINQCAWIKP